MLKVYGAGGTRARRVFWTCEELGIPFEIVPMQFPPRLHHPEYLAISPAGAVPAIEDDGTILIESLAICEYLDRTHRGGLALSPDDPAYYDYLQLLQFGEGTLAPPVGWARRFGGRWPEALDEAGEIFTLRLRVVERVLADGRAFLAAGRLTLADISVGYVLGLANGTPLYARLPPAVAAYEAGLKARPAYQRAYAR